MGKCYALSEIAEILAAVAQGKKAAEMVIIGAKLVDVHNKKIIPNIDVAMTHGRIALVGNAQHTIGKSTKVIHAKGAYITPGFMDSHIHIENSMMSITELAKLTIPHGTSTVYINPYNIQNIVGMEGINLILKESEATPLKVYMPTSFCKRVTPSFQDPNTNPKALLSKGHMDHMIRCSINRGVDPITAIKMVTLNVAQRFHMDEDLGSITPGKYADILLLNDLTTVKIDKVIINGKLIAQKGCMLIDLPEFSYPKHSIHFNKALTPYDFVICSNIRNTCVRTPVIHIMESKSNTYKKQCFLPNINSRLQLDIDQDILKLSVLKHHPIINMDNGFVKGIGLKEGAIASTVSNDSNNLLIVGTNEADMSVAGNALIEIGGGMIAVKDGEILAVLPLPIFGLISNESAQTIAKKAEYLYQAFRHLGCTLTSPFTTMPLLNLTPLPKLNSLNKHHKFIISK